jgi:hypothetical protein
MGRFGVNPKSLAWCALLTVLRPAQARPISLRIPLAAAGAPADFCQQRGYRCTADVAFSLRPRADRFGASEGLGLQSASISPLAKPDDIAQCHPTSERHHISQCDVGDGHNNRTLNILTS